MLLFPSHDRGDTAPTQAIVDILFNSGTPKDVSSYGWVKAYYRMEEGSGQEVSDSKGSFDLVLGANSGSSTDDPTWEASLFGWDAGEEETGFNKFTGFKKW